VNQLQDGLVQLRQAEELTLAQGRQHPALNDLNSNLCLGLGKSHQMQIVWDPL